ncbi:MAG: T9SS type A sorting domain-containing protein, partial [Cyclobacteriaceae bacterium]
RFKAIYGSESFVKEAVSGDQFIFYGVYPNPVSDQSNLLFSIPEGSESQVDVKVRLYNPIGQDIANFTYQFNESGIQEQPLFLRDLSISAGLYIVEVQSEGIRRQSRILIK